MKSRIGVLAACLVLALPIGALAREHYHEQAVKADTKDAFDAVAADVRDELKPGGRYEYVKPDEKRTVDAKLAEMDALFEKTPTVAAMTQDQKIALFNAQESVNSILTLRDRDRVICKREAPVGSHIPVTSCHTYGQEIEAREGSKKIMNDWQRAPCVGDNPACHAQ